MVLQRSWITCWWFVLVHLFGLVGETWAIDIIRDGFPNGPLATAGMNSAIILMDITVMYMVD